MDKALRELAKAWPAGAGRGDALLRRLGHCGMGEVWLAVRSDGNLNREIAIKLPHLHSRTLADRFTREQGILSRLADARIAGYQELPKRQSVIRPNYRSLLDLVREWAPERTSLSLVHKF